jgi:hypothetical protein
MFRMVEDHIRLYRRLIDQASVPQLIERRVAGSARHRVAR